MRIRTVLVDDTPDIRMMLRIALAQTDVYDVVAEAGDGRAGVDAVEAEQPDLVLLDLAMPVMDGLEALPLMRAAAPEATVVVLSGFESSRLEQAAVAEGAVGYLQKGMPVNTLVETLGQLIDANGERPVRRNEVAPQPPRDSETELELVRSAMAIAAHEMNSSVYVIGGLTEMLRTRRDALQEETVESMLDSIAQQARVLEQQVRDLASAVRAQRGTLAVELAKVELFSALTAAAAGMPAGHNTEVRCPEELHVLADRLRLLQMLTNLLTNAGKYGKADEPVRLVAVTDGEMARVSVIDHGPGVPESFVPLLFEQYTRANGLAAGGTGLGLYLVRALAQAHGGWAWYEPTPGGGATFSFTVPLATREARQ